MLTKVVNYRFQRDTVVVATVLSRYVELAIILVRVHGNKQKYAFAHGLYRTLRIPLPIIREITLRGLPLLTN